MAASLFGLRLEELELGEMVGQGGSGEVFAARHRGTGTRVAAKIYPFDRLDPEFRPRERFQRECRILSRMEHPAFPALYGCGEDEDGKTGWALMEWIEGEPLSAHRAAPVAEVVRLAHGIASALDALHVQGMLHRDIAFDNVLVERRRFGLNPRLIDLGIAKDVSSNQDLTMAGAFLGRVGFASPELLTEEGAAGLVDPRSDVFSFGVLLFEWLSGAPPFPGETPERVLKAQKKKAAPKLVLREDAGEAGRELAAFVESLLETGLERRPQSDVVARKLGEMRKAFPRERLDVEPSPASVFRTPSLGYAFVPRRFDGAPTLRRLRAVSFPETAHREARAPAPTDVAPRTAQAAKSPGGRVVAGARASGIGGAVLALGVLAFLAACALAAYLVFR